MYADQPLMDYINDAASNKPAPGGGSVSALVGALGSTMAQMAANFTVGKEKFQDVEDEVQELLARCKDACARLLELMEEDIAAYSIVTAAYRMPRETPDQKAERTAKIQDALSEAMQVPLEACRQCLYLTQAVRSLAEVANPNLASDVGVAAIFARAAFQGAKLNVLVNLANIKDKELVIKTENEIDDAENEIEGLAEATLEKVHEIIGM
jgi:formiminotetrahydrofolate cyclodeaminase